MKPYPQVPVVQINVSWDDDEPVVDPEERDVHIGPGEPTVIIWRCDGSVASIDAIDFENPGPPYSNPRGEFTDPGPGGKRVMVVVDLCSREGDFKYSISATPKGGGASVKIDPMIRNQSP